MWRASAGPVAEHLHREASAEGDELVLFTMKSQDTRSALEDLRAAAGDEVPVVMVQNGVGNERMAARRFRHVYASLVYLPTTFIEDGEVVLHSVPPCGVLDTGRFPGGTDGRAQALCGALEQAGFSARPDAGVMRLKYGKLLMNLRNAVRALWNGEGDVGWLGRALREEGEACYRAAGIAWEPVEEMRRRYVSRMQWADVPGVPRPAGSTWQSLRRGRRATEADWLNGEVALLGQLHGVPTPYNRALQAMAAEAAREGRPPGAWSLPELEGALAARGLPVPDPPPRTTGAQGAGSTPE